MAEDKDLHSKIKESFDRTAGKAPEGLWDNISDELDAQSDDPVMDEKIKSSFEEANSTKAPDHVWQSVNRQLNIDRTWERIRAALDRQQLFRALSRVAALLILLFIAGWGLKTYISKSEQNINTDKQVAAENNEAAEKNVPEKQLLNNTPGDDKEKQINTRETVEKSRKEQNETHREETNEPLISENENHTGTENTAATANNEQGSGQKDTHSDHDASADDNDASPLSRKKTPTTEAKTDEPNSVQQTQGQEVTATISEAPGKNKGEHGSNNSTNENTSPEQNDDLNYMSKKPFPGKAELADLNPFSMKKAGPLTTTDLDDQQEISNNAEKNSSKFRVGIFYAMNNTAIFNNATRESRESTSLISSEKVLTGNCAFSFDYNLTEKHGLNAVLYSRSVNQQKYYAYHEGNYVEKDLILEYSKLNLNYTYNFNLNLVSSIGINNIISAGAYASYLKSAEMIINDEQQSTEGQYSKFDYGLHLSAGQEIEVINNVLFGYGIHTERGLKNIFTGTENISPEVDKTKLSNTGIYLTLKYKL